MASKWNSLIFGRKLINFSGQSPSLRTSISIGFDFPFDSKIGFNFNWNRIANHIFGLIKPTKKSSRIIWFNLKIGNIFLVFIFILCWKIPNDTEKMFHCASLNIFMASMWVIYISETKDELNIYFFLLLMHERGRKYFAKKKTINKCSHT